MAQNFQITQVNSSGSVVVMHPESNADLIVSGATYQVPTIAYITDWNNRSAELVTARKGEVNLKAKIDKIDVALSAPELLKAIKTVDGTNSGLDADLVDGCSVSDSLTTTTNLWTASGTQAKLNEKVNVADVVLTATPNKLLKLNSSGVLPTSVTGNAGTASALASALNLNFGGDVTGTASFTGKEGNVSVNLEIKDNSHSHSTLGDIAVNNDKQDNLSLWTALKISQELSNVGKEAADLVSSVVSVKEGEILIGSLRIKYGAVDITDANAIDIDFENPFNTLLFNGQSCETSDVNIVATVVPGSATKDGIQFNLNKVALDGKLIWFAIGL